MLGTGCLARYLWLRLRLQHCLAQGASFNIIGCAYGGSIAFHRVPRSLSWDALTSAPLLGTWCVARYHWLRCLARYHWLRFSGSIAWHVVPRSISLASRTTAAILGTWCLARYHWPRLRRQHCLARAASLEAKGCAYSSSMAWHNTSLDSKRVTLRRQHRLTPGDLLDYEQLR